VPFVSLVLLHRGFPAEYGPKMAVATSLATICFTSMASVWAHHRKGAVLWPVALQLAPGIVLGAALGAQLAVALPNRLLGLLFAFFIAYSATQMFLDRKPKPGRTLPGWRGMAGVGVLIGGLSSLVGAGGAFMSVPFMTWCNVRIHQAVATSAALGFPVAVAGTLGYIWAGRHMPPMPPGSVGYLYVPGLVVIACASMSMAPLGARVAHSLDIRPLKRVFSVALYGLAAYFLFR